MNFRAGNRYKSTFVMLNGAHPLPIFRKIKDSMAGIYIHIPYCKKACHYCNFHFSTTLNSKNGFIAALLKEISLQKGYTGDGAIHTIYFGGGTPSLLNHDELTQILSRITDTFDVRSDAEITLEANP